MVASTERNTTKVRHDKAADKFILTHEYVIEMDSADVIAKVNVVKNNIEQIEFHMRRLNADLKNAQQELKSLQEVLGSTGGLG